MPESPTRHENNSDLVQYSIFTENMNYPPLPEPLSVTTAAVTSPAVVNSTSLTAAQVAPQQYACHKTTKTS
mgnify:CR=1 FL=1|jgi:hypothetical protein